MQIKQNIPKERKSTQEAGILFRVGQILLGVACPGVWLIDVVTLHWRNWFSPSQQVSQLQTVSWLGWGLRMPPPQCWDSGGLV